MAVLMGPVLASRCSSRQLGPGVLIVSDSKPPNLNWTREAEPRHQPGHPPVGTGKAGRL